MSIKALDWAMETPIKDPLAKLVLICIANHHNPSHGYAWPSVGHLCHITGASDATVRRKLKQLEELGLITRKHRAGRSTSYFLQFDTPVTQTVLSHRQDTPVTVTGITLKEPLNKHKGKTKVSDWVPSEADKQWAIDNGADWHDTLTSIKLWSKQNGDKAAYVDMSAFWQNWIRRDKSRKPASKQISVAKPDKHETSAKLMLARWETLTPSQQSDWYNRNPVIRAHIDRQNKSAEKV